MGEQNSPIFYFVILHYLVDLFVRVVYNKSIETNKGLHMAKVFIRKGKWQQQDIEKMTFDAISSEVMSGRNGFVTWGPRVRIGNRPEIVVIDIKR